MDGKRIEYAKQFYADKPDIVDDNWYAGNFRLCGIDQLCGEASPSYATLPYAALAHMRRLSPQAKLIYTIRRPFDRAWSHMRMLIGEREAHSVEAQYQLLADCGEMLRAHTDYATNVRKLQSVFGKDNVLLLGYSRIASDPLSYIRDVTDFLGLSFDFAILPIC